MEHGDPFFHMADYRAYVQCQEQVSQNYRDQDDWTRKAVLNVARMSKFSSDRTIREYAEEIWKLRPLHVRVRGRDVSGEPILLEASGLEARVLQHEIDHLDGVLILDRTQREQRKGALRALREGTEFAPERPEPAAAEA